MSFSDNKSITNFSLQQPALFSFSPVQKKPLSLSFTGADISSDGGLLFIRESERNTGIVRAIAACLPDDRHAGRTRHSYYEMLMQRTCQIAGGYEDADDCDSLRSDDILKLCADRLPSQPHLASQPTMSRFENKATNSNLYRIANAFLENFIQSYAEEPKVIILDADDTDSTTYGGQQLALYNNYYGDYCYQPLHIYEGLTGKLVTTLLKPGRRSKSVNVFSILSRLIKKLRLHWKNTIIIVRGDSHFCSREFMDWCEEQKNVHFITGLASNKVLNELATMTIASAKREHQQTGKPVKRYHSFEYKAGSWAAAQRVVVKVEMSDRGLNIRYIVSDMREWKTQELYEKGYCARGAAELRIKEHKTYLQSDRMSCSRFNANQFRLFLHSAAYVLMHNLQTQTLAATQYAKSTFKTIREKIFKIAAYVKEMKTRIKIEFPRTCPSLPELSRSLKLFEYLRG